MKDLRCICGFHDWVWVESTSTSVLVNEYVEWLENRFKVSNLFVPTIFYNGSYTVENKVCVRCSKVEADIVDFKRQLPDLYNEAVRRKKEKEQRIADYKKDQREKDVYKVETAEKIFENYRKHRQPR